MPLNQLSVSQSGQYTNANYSGFSEGLLGLGVDRHTITAAGPIIFTPKLLGVQATERAQGSGLPNLPGTSSYVIKTACRQDPDDFYWDLLELINELQITRWTREPLASMLASNVGKPCILRGCTRTSSGCRAHGNEDASCHLHRLHQRRQQSDRAHGTWEECNDVEQNGHGYATLGNLLAEVSSNEARLHLCAR